MPAKVSYEHFEDKEIERVFVFPSLLCKQYVFLIFAD